LSPENSSTSNIPQPSLIQQLPLLPESTAICHGVDAVPLISGAYFDAVPKHALNKTEKALIIAYDEQQRIERWTRAYDTKLRVERRYQERQTEAYNNRKYTVTINHDMVKIKAYGIRAADNPGGGRRGSITGFSSASRKRMLEFLATIRWDMGEKTVFATLTYPGKYASVPAWDINQWKSDFEALRRRIERLSDEIMLIWRKEFVRRKSGETKGIYLPHYHCIIFIPDNLDMTSLKMPDGTKLIEVDELKLNPDKRRVHSSDSRLIEAWLLAHWHDIAGRGDDNHRTHGVHCSPITSRRHAYYYVSKYVGKVESDKFEIGRRWGRVGKFDTSPLWVTDMTPDEYIEFKRLVARWMRSRGGKYWKKFVRMPIEVGCSVFGLGDSSNPAFKTGFDSTICDMLVHATGLILQKMDEKRLNDYN